MTNVAKLQEEITTALIGLASMDNANNSSEVCMIQLQDLVAKQALATQMATSLFKEMSSLMKTIAGNIGR